MDTRPPDLNLLATLEALLSERNVTNAAKRLNMSQPAVSAQLARLRLMFDDPLLLPTRRGMIATANAEALSQPLREALDQVRAVIAGHRSFDPTRTELSIAIACSDYVQHVVVMPLVIELAKEAPGIRVAIHQFSDDVERLMAQGKIDLAFAPRHEVPPALRFRPVFDERYVLIVRRDHPVVEGEITLSQLEKLDHVVVSPSGGAFATQVDHEMRSLGITRKVVLSAASFLIIPDVVARSDMVAFVPARLVLDRSGELQVLQPPLAIDGFEMAMFWHDRNNLHDGQRWIRDTILRLFQTGELVSQL